MSMIKLCTEGCWWLRSKSDRRWNADGHSDFVGGFSMPYECCEKLRELKRCLGKPPKDLEWGYMKD